MSAPSLPSLSSLSGMRLLLARCLSPLLLVGLAACGLGPNDSEGLAFESQSAPIEGTNGLSTNGLSINGLSTNGLSTNGLSTNGLSTNGFSTWFDLNPTLNDEVMKYIVKCAVPAGQQRSYTSPSTQTTYTWQGLLGLAPDWASGSTASTAEQEVVSACIAAHANKYGVSIPISVLGRDANGVDIASSQAELSTYSEQEACFFGNLFTDSTIFVGNDRFQLKSNESTARACALSSNPNATSNHCPPLIHIGACKLSCTAVSGSDFYATCTANGHAYKAITTRLRPQEIYTCGDGVCQFTEQCGTGSTADNCGADCGPCP